MTEPTIINQTLLDHVSTLARHNPRRRKNYNFHQTETDHSHRLLNAVEPDSYVRPHCHLSPDKDETMIVLRGKIGVIFFDAAGKITEKALLLPQAEMAVNIPHGLFHTIVALEPGTVFFEAKSGPYLPLTETEKAPWAPAEGSATAPHYLMELKSLF